MKRTCTTNAAHELRAARCDFQSGTRSLGLLFAFHLAEQVLLPRFKRMDVSCVTVNESEILEVRSC